MKKILFIACLGLARTLFAHPGKLEKYNGHKDTKNISGLGEYHYHCNNTTEHLHVNKECPYNKEILLNISFTNENQILTSYKINISTFLKARDVCNLLNIDIVYVKENNTIVCVKDDKTLIIDKPLIINGSTIVPLRQIFEYYGYSVEYNKGLITITEQKDN